MTNHKGLTLLEAVIAMALFFVAVLAFAGAAITASKGAAASKHLTTASTLAQDKLEQMKNTGYDARAPLETVEAYGDIPDFSLYQRVVRIETGLPVPSLQTVTVTVSWADDRHSVTVSTILAP
ncbi:MAG: prepilin-type N-terminal cleavage/methylation domain-containing protein [Nitrospira sp.]|nr:prepilin-type N-terminal cleavage/methylation domain-containing protein [Nitrospira sp.]